MHKRFVGFGKKLSNQTILLVFVLIFGTIGSIALVASHAATSTASIEAANPTAPATTVSDTTASGGSAVRFGAASSGGGTAICTGRDGSGGVPAGTLPGAACTGVPSGTTLQLADPNHLTTYTQAGGNNCGWTWDATNKFFRINGNGCTTASNSQYDAVFDGLDIRGRLYSSQPATVLIKNSHVRGDIYCTTSCSQFVVQAGPGSLIVDSEFGGGDDGNTVVPSGEVIYAKATNPDSIIIQRNYFHKLSHAAAHADGGVTFVDNYVGPDLILPSSTDTDAGVAHIDGVMVEFGGNVTIRHNNFAEWDNNAHFFVQNKTQPTLLVSNILVENNYFQSWYYDSHNTTGACPYSCTGYVSKAILVEDRYFNGQQNTVNVRNNIFDRTWASKIITLPSGAQHSGNTYSDNGSSADGDVTTGAFIN